MPIDYSQLETEVPVAPKKPRIDYSKLSEPETQVQEITSQERNDTAMNIFDQIVDSGGEIGFTPEIEEIVSRNIGKFDPEQPPQPNTESLEWSSVVGNPRWNEQSPQQREDLRDKYFRTVLLNDPGIDILNDDEIRGLTWQFLRDTQDDMMLNRPKINRFLNLGHYGRLPTVEVSNEGTIPDQPEDFNPEITVPPIDKFIPSHALIAMEAYADASTFGMLPRELGEEIRELADTPSERVAQMAGSAAGFVLGAPAKLVAGPVSKGVQKVLAKSLPLIEGKVTQWMARRGVEAVAGGAGLGVASASMKPEDSDWWSLQDLQSRARAGQQGIMFGVGYRYGGMLPNFPLRTLAMSGIGAGGTIVEGGDPYEIAYRIFEGGLFATGRHTPLTRVKTRGEVRASAERKAGEIAERDRMRNLKEEAEVAAEQRIKGLEVEAQQNRQNRERVAEIEEEVRIEKEHRDEIVQRELDALIQANRETVVRDKRLHAESLEAFDNKDLSEIALEIRQENYIEAREKARRIAEESENLDIREVTRDAALWADSIIEGKRRAEELSGWRVKNAKRRQKYFKADEFRKLGGASQEQITEIEFLRTSSGLDQATLNALVTVNTGLRSEAELTKGTASVMVNELLRIKATMPHVLREHPELSILDGVEREWIKAPGSRERSTQLNQIHKIRKKTMDGDAIDPAMWKKLKYVPEGERLPELPKGRGDTPDDDAEEIRSQVAEIEKEVVAEKERRDAQVESELSKLTEEQRKKKVLESETVQKVLDKQPTKSEQDQITLMHAGLHPAEGVKRAKEYAQAFENKYEWQGKGYFEAFESVFSRPKKLVSRSRDGKVWMDVVDNIHTETGLIQAPRLKMMEQADRHLTRDDVIWMQRNFKTWHESGQPEVQGLTPEIRNWGKVYQEMKNQFADISDQAGVLVKRPLKVGELITQSMRELVELEGRQSSGEEGLGQKIAGKKRRIKNLKEKSMAGIVKSTENVYEPFGMHVKKNHFTHSLSPEARSAINRGQGREWEAIRDYAIRNNVDLKLLKDMADPLAAPMDKKFGSLEEMRMAELPDVIPDAKGKAVRLLETDPFQEYQHYINGASSRIASINSIRNVPGYGVGDYPHYRSAIEAFIADRKNGMIADGSGKKRISLAEGVWDGVMGFQRGIGANFTDNPVVSGILSAESIARAGTLSMSQVTNAVGGWYPIYAQAGLKPFAKAVVNVTKAKLGNKEAQRQLDMTRDLMGWTNDYFRFTEETSSLHKRAGEFSKESLRVLGFEAANRMLNKAASLAGYDFLTTKVSQIRAGHKDSQFFREQMKRDFGWKDADIDRMIESGATKKEYGKVVQEFVAKSNIFRENPGDIPPWMRTEWGSRIMSLNSFNRAMGNMLSDAIGEVNLGYKLSRQAGGSKLKSTGEAIRHTDKLGRLLLGGAASEFVLDTFRDLMYARRDHDEEWFEFVFNTIMGSGAIGLLGSYYEDLKWSHRFGNDYVSLESLKNLTAPPQWEKMFDFTSELYDVIAEQDEKSVNDLAKTVPVFRFLNVQTRRALEGKMDVDNRKKKRGGPVRSFRTPTP
jgi:hypothetical protein